MSLRPEPSNNVTNHVFLCGFWAWSTSVFRFGTGPVGLKDDFTLKWQMSKARGSSMDVPRSRNETRQSEADWLAGFCVFFYCCDNFKGVAISALKTSDLGSGGFSRFCLTIHTHVLLRAKPSALSLSRSRKHVSSTCLTAKPAMQTQQAKGRPRSICFEKCLAEEVFI